MPSGFPDGFLWGVAAAAYQVEGAPATHGKRPSVWDAFCDRPGAVFEGHTGRQACDHYRRYPEDVALMADLGVRAYRLSLSWPRIIPTGTGPVSEEGLDFYDRLVDTLLSHGVQPWVTLFHWDYPIDLFHRGGWLNRETANWFAKFATVVGERLGDRVKHWMTLNEPQVFLGLGHVTGIHAPGMQYALPDVLLATHNTLIAHGKAVRALRSVCGGGAKIGWAPHVTVPFPASKDERDIAAARAAFSGIPEAQWYFSTSWFADPAILGHYPEVGLKLFGELLPRTFEDDLALIHQPLDFFGANIYQGRPVIADDDGAPRAQARVPGYAHTMAHWPAEPQVLYWGPRFLAERYNLPIYITENGCACMDWVHADGKVHDAPRIDYLARHLVALRAAVAEGADVRGYFHWSLLDNFEWAEGYRMRFGLVYVDYETLERIPKDAYTWYQQVILSNGGCLPETPAPLR